MNHSTKSPQRKSMSAMDRPKSPQSYRMTMSSSPTTTTTLKRNSYPHDKSSYLFDPDVPAIICLPKRNDESSSYFIPGITARARCLDDCKRVDARTLYSPRNKRRPTHSTTTTTTVAVAIWSDSRSIDEEEMTCSDYGDMDTVDLRQKQSKVNEQVTLLTVEPKEEASTMVTLPINATLTVTPKDYINAGWNEYLQTKELLGGTQKLAIHSQLDAIRQLLQTQTQRMHLSFREEVAKVA